MSSRTKSSFILCVSLLLAVACSKGSSNTPDSGDTDTGTGTGTDTGTGDPVVPEDWIGEPCTVDGDECNELSGEHPSAFCFAVVDDRGFCTMECEPASDSNPGEDPCGESGVCSNWSWLLGGEVTPSAFCVQTCVPKGGSNPCRADYLRCDPASWAFEKLTSTCLLAACISDEDCPVPVGTVCTGPGNCDVVAAEECMDLGGGLECVTCGNCNPTTGRCDHFGQAGVQVGTPCDTVYDCGRNMECMVERPYSANGAQVIYENGYCTKTGCSAVTTNNFGLGNQSSEISVIDELGCGVLGVCRQDYRGGGRCYHRCDPQAEAEGVLSCRQLLWDGPVGDRAGTYECYDQSQYGLAAYGLGDPDVIGWPPVVSSPYCSWVGPQERCQGGMAVPPNQASTCAELFALGAGTPDYWGMNMTCRDPATGQEVQDGFCLDDTTSHWTGTWSTEAQDAGVDGG